MEVYSLLTLKLFNSILGDLSLILHIFFVSNEEEDDIWFALGHDLIVPCVKICESLQPRDIIC